MLQLQTPQFETVFQIGKKVSYRVSASRTNVTFPGIP